MFIGIGNAKAFTSAKPRHKEVIMSLSALSVKLRVYLLILLSGVLALGIVGTFWHGMGKIEILGAQEAKNSMEKEIATKLQVSVNSMALSLSKALEGYPSQEEKVAFLKKPSKRFAMKRTSQAITLPILTQPSSPFPPTPLSRAKI